MENSDHFWCFSCSSLHSKGIKMHHTMSKKHSYAKTNNNHKVNKCKIIISTDKKWCNSIPIKCTQPFPKVIVSPNLCLKGLVSRALLWATALSIMSVSFETQTYLCQGCSLKSIQVMQFRQQNNETHCITLELCWGEEKNQPTREIWAEAGF